MTQDRFRFVQSAVAAFTLLFTAGPFNGLPAAAGPFNGPGEVATPTAPNTHFVQLKQISGFTGNMSFGYADGGYSLAGTSFNKLITLRFTVNCPANYRVHEAGIRVRGSDVHNYDVALVSPGDVPFDENHWEQTLQEEPWDFAAVQTTGIAALDAAGNNGPVYVSLNDKLDSRTEFYGSCSPSQPSSGLPFLYYDSAEDNGHLRPMTRVRYALVYSAAKQADGPQKLAPTAAVKAVPIPAVPIPAVPMPKVKARIKAAPGGCPYDCPPPAPRRLRLAN